MEYQHLRNSIRGHQQIDFISQYEWEGCLEVKMLGINRGWIGEEVHRTIAEVSKTCQIPRTRIWTFCTAFFAEARSSQWEVFCRGYEQPERSFGRDYKRSVRRSQSKVSSNSKSARCRNDTTGISRRKQKIVVDMGRIEDANGEWKVGQWLFTCLRLERDRGWLSPICPVSTFLS